ncbi:Modification methylase RsrI [Pandoraea terrae]|uniref:Methyltransferase n=1 Tax=Pandoraea terrae TaxID=1537710 RepID=A0A5E4VVI9_9BURK|nr:site-specific DNA-methyltransferase [Pandoraea terrae]VVE16151.1 Modification methylase RsrI [Pandoraea terrae]
MTERSEPNELIDPNDAVGVADAFDGPDGVATPSAEVAALEGSRLAHPSWAPGDINLRHADFLAHVGELADGSVDLILADPPYGLGKDYGNDSDKRSGEDFLAWTYGWLEAALPKLAPRGSLYLFCTWQYAPELFVFLKQRLLMVNEIIWDRRVPSMGGSTRRFSSVHDNIGVFAVSKDYYFDLDAVRVPYDAATKKARSRRIFEGSKWLELGYNPKDLWSISRLHRQDPERVDHPTQKPLHIIERMVLASCPPGGLVLDPFMGSGTTAVACALHSRRFVGYEINPHYHAIAHQRLQRLNDHVTHPSDVPHLARAG